MMKIVLVVAARPNFMKVAPILSALMKYPDEFEPVLVHTGQHYDVRMSDVFFRDLGLPDPHRHLGVGSGSHAVQTAGVMTAFEPVLLEERPDMVVVVGDVNSTMACAIDAAKLGIPVAHVEAGLRSRDRSMPEEVNRLVTDAISDLLLTPSADADENLRAEGVPPERIFRVGNVMIDTLRRLEVQAEASEVLAQAGVDAGGYALTTLHRPSNVDDAAVFRGLLEALDWVQQRLPVVFPIHPRTRKTIAQFGFEAWVNGMAGVKLIEPVGYLDFLKLQKHAQLVLTDSGGVQEETTALGVPCLTLRENTERPVTVDVGSNTLVGMDPARIVATATEVLEGRYKRSHVPEFWDGNAAGRVVEVFRKGKGGNAKTQGRKDARKGG